MREIPILFSAPMMRANLAGVKDVTRRIVKRAHIITTDDRTGVTDAKCPYGSPGDVLIARETWRPRVSKHGGTRGIEYRADGAMNLTEMPNELYTAATKSIPLELWCPSRRDEFVACCDRWRPSIHMPRWACRFTAPVVSVRIERLQEITLSDCEREGSPPTHKADNVWDCTDTYAALWDSINGKGSWDANPWVWRIEYRNPHKEYA